MAAVRCPKCGTINYEGIASYPRCRRCREQLRKCRYCSHFDRRILDCAHPLLRDGSHINDPDLDAACPQHASILRVGARGKAAALLSSPPVLTVLALAVVLGIGGYSFGHYYLPSNVVMAPRLTMTASAHPTPASVGQLLWITVDIANRGRVPAEHVTLYVHRSFIEHFAEVELSPIPQGSSYTPQWEQLDFGRLGPGAGLTVRYSFEAKESGAFPLRLQLRSAHGMSHGSARISVAVGE
jgi:hypothetical protein